MRTALRSNQASCVRRYSGPPNWSARILLVAFLVGTLVPACANEELDTGTSPTTTTTAEPAAAIVAEDFVGTVAVRGSRFYSFSVPTSGTVNVTLVSMTGQSIPSTIQMGLGIGVPNAEDCAISTSITTASGAGPHLAGTYNAGVYCVRIHDLGNLFSAATFTISIAHP